MPLSRAEYLGDRYIDFKRQRVVEDNAIMQKIGHLIHGKIMLNIIIEWLWFLEILSLGAYEIFIRDEPDLPKLIAALDGGDKARFRSIDFLIRIFDINGKRIKWAEYSLKNNTFA